MTGQKTAELIKVVDEMTVLLKQHSEENWVSWMGQVSARLKNSDYSGIEKLLGAYGGMGSFNDFVLIAKPSANEQLNVLRHKAWQLATDIKRDYTG